jgi:hypothetical protein
VYNVLFQYRRLGEWIIGYGKEIADAKATEEHDLEVRALRIAKFMRYYSFICLQMKQLFLVEVISHDIRSMIEKAFHDNSILHDKLLEIFLTVDDDADASSRGLPGIRKAQIILATTYIVANKHEYARKIQEDFADESHKQLWSWMQELMNVSNREFWEVSERGTRCC